MRLFMYMTLAEAVFYWYDPVSHRLCDSGLVDLFSYTVFFSNDYYDKFRALNCLIFMVQFGTSFTLFMNTFLNICLCIDLVLMLRRPFMKKDALMPRYLGFSVVMSAISALLLQPRVLAISPVILDFSFFYHVACIVAYVLIVVFSIVYGCISLSKPGISREVKWLILIRHITTVLFIFLAYSYIFLGLGYEVYMVIQGE